MLSRSWAVTGLGVAAFAALLVVTVAHSPLRFSDTPTYVNLSFSGSAERLWTVPLIWKLLPSDDLRAAFQVLLGVAAWSLLACVVARVLADPWTRRFGFVAVLMLGLVPDIAGWDTTLLSESLSTSFLVASIAVALWLTEQRSTPLIAAWLTVTALWMFTRQSNVGLYLLLCPFVIGYLWVRARRARTVWITTAAMVVLALWGGYAITRGGAAAQAVSRWNALQILEMRIAPDPAALRFFTQHGMPQSPVIKAERGHFPGSVSPLFSDARFMAWVARDYESTYAAYMLEHVRYTLGEPIVQMPGAISTSVGADIRTRTVLPAFAQESMWGQSRSNIAFWFVLAVILLAVTIRRRIRLGHRGALLAGLALFVVIGSIATYNTTGYQPGGGELSRLFLPVAVIARIGLLLTIVVCVDGLRGRRAAEAQRPEL